MEVFDLEHKNQSEYETLALAEHAKKQKNTQIAMPSEENVKEAKDWVDSNEK